jgi:hypothetical protein
LNARPANLQRGPSNPSKTSNHCRHKESLGV